MREESIDGLGIRNVIISAPKGVSIDRTIKRLGKLLPQATLVPNHLYFQSGAEQRGTQQTPATPSRIGPGAIGIIDGGVARHPSLTGPVEQRGFVRGSPVTSAHGTAVASLMVGSGAVRGPAPGAPLLVADVYGSDKTGGNAVAIARALGWMVERQSRIVAVSLVGPPNALIAKAVSAAQSRGLVIVAAVGNDGAAAPPSYPASYPGVIAVTAVDRDARVLIEAGRSLHVDFAAPGADMVAASHSGGTLPVRGTSYAVPLVAALAWVAASAGNPAHAQLEKVALDLGKPGRDPVYGYGLVCGLCRNLTK